MLRDPGGVRHAAACVGMDVWDLRGASKVTRMGMRTLNRPVGWRNRPGFISSLRHRVLPSSRASARNLGLKAMSGGVPSISAVTSRLVVFRIP